MDSLKETDKPAPNPSKHPRIEVDEELMRQMIAGQAPLDSKVVRRIPEPEEEDTDTPEGNTSETVSGVSAPTAEKTIRLLELPGAWSQYLDANPNGTSCLGPVSGLDKQRSQYAAAVRSLSDPAETQLVLVARAHRASIRAALAHCFSICAVNFRSLHFWAHPLHFWVVFKRLQHWIPVFLPACP